MSKSNAAANVIDLEAFRQRKQREERTIESTMATPAVLVPVWFCWVPVWTPMP